MRSPADAVPSWVWVPEVAAAGDRLTFSEAGRHHVRRVCRARPGDALVVTDGRGAVARVRLDDAGTATVLERRVEPRPAPAVLACGAPEGERGDWLVEKLAELGIAAFQPVDTERARWPAGGTRLERWQRLARAALQQSRGAWTLELRPACRLPEFLAGLPAGAAYWLADADGPPVLAAGPPGESAVGLVGPSPGLTPAERAAVHARGFRPICLAQRRLRAETAALAWAAWWAAAGAGGAGAAGA